MRHSKLEDTTKLRAVIAKSQNYLQTLLGMGLKGYSDNYYTLKEEIAKHNINIEHFKETSNGRLTHPNRNGFKLIPLDDILTGKYPEYRSWGLKKRLVKSKRMKDQCVECGIGPVYNNKPISLQLDHKDGNRRNHMLNNLRILCPNCHSQTDNFSGRNKKH